MQTNLLITLVNQTPLLPAAWRDELARQIIADKRGAAIKVLAGPTCTPAIVKQADNYQLTRLIERETDSDALDAVPIGRKAARQALIEHTDTPASALDRIARHAHKHCDWATLEKVLAHRNVSGATRTVVAEPHQTWPKLPIGVAAGCLTFQQLQDYATVLDTRQAITLYQQVARTRPDLYRQHAVEILDIVSQLGDRQHGEHHTTRGLTAALASELPAEVVATLDNRNLARMFTHRAGTRNWKDPRWSIDAATATELTRVPRDTWAEILASCQLEEDAIPQLLPLAGTPRQQNLVKLLMRDAHSKQQTTDVLHAIALDLSNIEAAIRYADEREDESVRDTLIARLIGSGDADAELLAAVAGTYRGARERADQLRSCDTATIIDLVARLSQRTGPHEQDELADLIGTLALEDHLDAILPRIHWQMEGKLAELFRSTPHTIVAGPMLAHTTRLVAEQLPAESGPQIISLLAKWTGSVDELLELGQAIR